MALGDDLSVSVSAGGVGTVAAAPSATMMDLGVGGELELQRPLNDQRSYFAGVYGGGSGTAYRVPDSDNNNGRSSTRERPPKLVLCTPESKPMLAPTDSNSL